MGDLAGLLVLLGIGFAVAIGLLSALVAREFMHPPRHTAGWAVARGMSVDPGDLGLPFEEWRLETGGASLPVWEIRGSGRPDLTAVLLHAWGESRIDALGCLPPFDELCDRLVLVDLRGHGEATGGASRLGHGEEHDVLALLERLGAGPFVLAGHGLGAVTAIRAAAASSPMRDRIAGVVACAPYSEVHGWMRSRMRLAGYPSWPLTDLALVWMRLAGLRFPGTDAAAAAIGCPLLVVAAEDDPVSVAGFIERCRTQPGPAASASSSGPRWRS